MASTGRQRWVRVPPALAWKRPGLPTEWTRVLELDLEAMNPEPLPGYLTLAMLALDTTPETGCVNVLKVGGRFTANAEPSRTIG